MLTYILFALFLISCVVLVIAVLLQPGKADAGALFTSSVSTTAFGPRGTQSVLAKITIVAAGMFMITALLLSLGVGGPRSVMEGGAVPTPTPAATATPSAENQPAEPAQGEGATANPSPATAASPAASPENK